ASRLQRTGLGGNTGHAHGRSGDRPDPGWDAGKILRLSGDWRCGRHCRSSGNRLVQPRTRADGDFGPAGRIGRAMRDKGNHKRRIVDLSVYLENGVLSDPQPLSPRITYQDHRQTVAEFERLYPGTTAADYPD